MASERPEGAPVQPQPTAWEIATIKNVAAFLAEDGYKFHYLADACLEMYLQGKNFTMRMIIYAHKQHLIVRIPSFIRNVDLRRLDITLALLRIMYNYYDLRFELSEDGHSLSAACNLILEDAVLTKNQCIQCFMAAAYVVDENYPALMRIIYGDKSEIQSAVDNSSGKLESPDASDNKQSEDGDEESDDKEDDEEDTFSRHTKLN